MHSTKRPADRQESGDDECKRRSPSPAAKRQKRHGKPCVIEVAAGSHHGKKQYNQDERTVHNFELGQVSCLFAAVYDGHGEVTDNGSVSSRFLRDKLHLRFLQELALPSTTDVTSASTPRKTSPLTSPPATKSNSNAIHNSNGNGKHTCNTNCSYTPSPSSSVSSTFSSPSSIPNSSPSPRPAPSPTSSVAAASSFTDSCLPLTNKLPITETTDPAEVQRILRAAVTASFKQADKELLAELCKSNGGSCAVAAICSPGSVLIANTGDSKAVLARWKPSTNGEPGSVRAVSLSKEHRTTLLQERSRIQKAGATVTDGRVNGLLGVTRSFGDPAVKNAGVICTPELSHLSVTENDLFIILGCDGLWETFTSAEAVSFVYDQLTDGLHQSLQSATSALVREAVLRHCTDNVTAVVLLIRRPEDRPIKDTHTPPANKKQ